jgi:hypothetical protein
MRSLCRTEDRQRAYVNIRELDLRDSDIQAAHHRFDVDPVGVIPAEQLTYPLAEPAPLLAWRQLADLGDIERQIESGQPPRSILDVVLDDARGQKQDVRQVGRWADGSAEKPGVCASDRYQGARPGTDYKLSDE